MLERPPARSQRTRGLLQEPGALRAELAAFAREHGLPPDQAPPFGILMGSLRNLLWCQGHPCPLEPGSPGPCQSFLSACRCLRRCPAVVPGRLRMLRVLISPRPLRCRCPPRRR